MISENLQYDFLSLLQKKMSFHDIYPPYVNLKSTSIERFKSINICRHNCCYYVIFNNCIGAQFGCWRRDIHEKWFVKELKHFSYAEINAYKIQQEKLKKERIEKEAIALLRSQTIWNKSKDPDQNHSYLLTKKIKPYYIRQHGDNLIIPIYSQEGKLKSIQSIFPDGFKLYEKGSSCRGGFLSLGEDINTPIRLCEGYATGASIYEAVGSPVIVCFTAHNLIHIGKWIREMYPFIEIVFCADDDRKTEEEACTGKNTGLISAINAAKEINAKVIYPDFTNIPDSDNATDFNDLLCLTGIEEVESQLLKQ